uniref:Ras-GEF domain-containing protein n=1 Tax=Echinostoma caproni TaxID=27848 RepID=A0A183ASU8_9TREM
LTQTLFRRIVFCGSCSAYRAPIAFLGGKVKRVCVIDYYLIHGDLKPPTTAILEGILRRTQKDSASIETGYLYWCVYSQNTWNARPNIRYNKSAPQHKYLTLNAEPFCQSQSTTSIFFPIQTDTGDLKGDSGSRVAVSSGNDDDSDVTKPSGPRRKSNYPMRQGSNSSKDFSSSSELLSPNLKARSPSQYTQPTICLCRMYCVLQTDTLLSMYAARADSRAKDQLPLLGTRLFYLDQKADNVPDVPIVSNRKRSSSWVAPGCDLNGSQISSKSNATSSPSQSSLTSNHRANRASTASSNGVSDSSEDSIQNHQLVKPSEIRAGNPLYRNHKPPSLPVKPKYLSEVVRTLQEYSDGYVTRMAGQFESSVRLKRGGASDNGNSSTESSKPQCGFNQAETLKQLSSVSPTVLGVLQNKLGFLLLPMNTDCLAHYFEAPTYEVRTK